MNRIALFVGLALVSIGAVLMFLYKRRFEAEASGGAHVPVLVVARKLALGSTIADADVTTRSVPAIYVEDRQLRASDRGSVLGARVSTELRPGEALRWTDLATSTAYARNLSGLVKVGMRAAPLKAELGEMTGLLRPGDRIDLVLTTNPRSKRQRTAIVAQAVLVLSVGVDLGGPGGMNTPDRRAKGVTVALTVEQAQLITHAQGLGTLSAVLRNPDDLAVVDIAGALEKISVATENLEEGVDPLAASSVFDHVALTKQLQELAVAGREPVRLQPGPVSAAESAAPATEAPVPAGLPMPQGKP
jgi:pilus assembly protein CpaB